MFKKIVDWFTPIKIGEQWRYHSYNPFNEKSYVEIIDLKDGWVRYRILDSDTDSALEIKDFLMYYRKKGSN